jgi:hypothetical protein
MGLEGAAPAGAMQRSRGRVPEPPLAAGTGGLVQEPPGCHSWRRRREAQEWGKKKRKREPGSSPTHEAGATAQGHQHREPGGPECLCCHGRPRHREAGARVAAQGSTPRSCSRTVKPEVRPWVLFEVLRHDAAPRMQSPFRGAAGTVKTKPSEGAGVRRKVGDAALGSRTVLNPCFEPNHRHPTSPSSPSFTAAARNLR